MTEASQYSAIERLRDGRRLEVRALLPDDRDGILKTFNSSSLQSLRRRFFATVRSTGQCNTACSLSAGVSKPKVFRGR